MATVSSFSTMRKMPRVLCRKREKERERGGQNSNHPYKVTEISPPPKSLGIRCFPLTLQCGESVTIEGQAYMISGVTHRYQLRKGKYEPSEKRLDVLSTGRYILNLYLENLLEQSWDFYLLSPRMEDQVFHFMFTRNSHLHYRLYVDLGCIGFVHYITFSFKFKPPNRSPGLQQFRLVVR